MKKRIEDRKAIMAAVKEAAEYLRVPEKDIEVYEDSDEGYSVGFAYKNKIACSIDLGFYNGVEKAFGYSYQDLEYPTDGWEEYDTIEEAKDHMISHCDYCD